MRRRSLLAFPLTTPATASGLPRVVASFSILADITRQIAGDRCHVHGVIGPDRDAHGFEPRPSDLLALRGAQLLVRNGLGFEPWFDRAARAAAAAVPVVTATESVVPLPGTSVPDPHAWHDLSRAQTYVRTIGAALAGALPDGAAAFAAATAGYVDRLAALDAWVRQEVAGVPPERRVVVTGHAAFGYFAAAYGVRFLAAAGLSNAAEPSPGALAALIRRIRAERVTALFAEAGAASSALQRVAQETGVAVRGRLYAETLSAPEGPAPTFEAMVRHNVGLLVPAMRSPA